MIRHKPNTSVDIGIPGSPTGSNSFQKIALKYTRRFNIKFRIHNGMVGVNHTDGKYVATMFRYLKEFCVKFKEEIVFFCLYDKVAKFTNLHMIHLVWKELHSHD
jgi:hypothetical protein